MADREIKFKLDIIGKALQENRCPHLIFDEKTIRCGMFAQEDPTGRMVCDIYSLQLWCTGRHRNCMYHPEYTPV